MVIAQPMTFPQWGNRRYYWGSQYYTQDGKDGMCNMPIEPDDPYLGDIYMGNFSRPKEIVWSCSYYEEYVFRSLISHILTNINFLAVAATNVVLARTRMSTVGTTTNGMAL